MSYGNFILQNGVWVKKDVHSQDIPTNRLNIMLNSRQGPGAIVKDGMERLRNKLRRYDLPSKEELNRVRKEDDAEIEKSIPKMADIVPEARRDLESGKMRISPEVLNSRGSFHPIVDNRGITHVIPGEPDIKKYSDAELSAVQEEARKERDILMKKEGVVGCQIGRPRDAPGPPNAIRQRDVENKALDAIKLGINKGRTFG